jgi:hypothetical protein
MRVGGAIAKLEIAERLDDPDAAVGRRGEEVHTEPEIGIHEGIYVAGTVPSALVGGEMENDIGPDLIEHLRKFLGSSQGDDLHTGVDRGQ